jgi:hypothetical protein
LALETALISFCERLMVFMHYRKWNPTLFVLHTGLDVNFYSRIKNNRLKRPELRIVVSILIGLNCLTRSQRICCVPRG